MSPSSYGSAAHGKKGHKGKCLPSFILLFPSSCSLPSTWREEKDGKVEGREQERGEREDRGGERTIFHTGTSFIPVPAALTWCGVTRWLSGIVDGFSLWSAYKADQLWFVVYLPRSVVTTSNSYLDPSPLSLCLPVILIFPVNPRIANRAVKYSPDHSRHQNSGTAIDRPMRFRDFS